jgi:hypothetical protein
MTNPSRPFSQKRQFERVPIRMSAEVRSDEGTFTARTRDLSEGGAGLEPERPLVEGSSVALGLFLVVDDVEEEKTPPLWVKGRVAWTGETDEGRPMAGVRFEVITDQQKKWLRQVLGHLTPSPVLLD